MSLEEFSNKKSHLYEVDFTIAKSELRLFLSFLDKTPLFKSILDELRINRPDVDEMLAQWGQHRGQISWPDTELDKIKTCLALLERAANPSGLEPWNYGHMIDRGERNARANTRIFFTHVLEPISDYILEKISDGSNIMYLLQKFKAHTEWFEKENMYQVYQDNKTERKGEQILDKNLRKFLFENGVDYPFSQPSSPSGVADVVAGLESNDPLVLEIKIFDPDNGYDVSYVKQGITQIVSYSADYNKPIGYLVIFNVSPYEMKFTFANSYPIKIEINGKTFFIIEIDLFPRESASKRKDKSKEVSMNDLI